MVSPFLARYVLKATPSLCSLAQCETCSFRFFDSRLTPAEVEKLYSGYRGNEYFRVRHAVEPWYSKKVNDGIGGDPDEIRKRNDSLATFLGAHVEMGKIETILDYGGDRGQFIPVALGKLKFVFEVSAATPVDGVTRIGSNAELQERRFDFLLLCGVLEHCSEPLEILRALTSLAKGPDSLFYIGVPYERFDLSLAGTGKLQNLYLDLLRHTGPFLTLLDFYSTAARVRWDIIPPLGFMKCHEHLNFFNERSMFALLRRVGLEMIACSTTQTNTYPARPLSLNVLAAPSGLTDRARINLEEKAQG
jgi:hypothetical protein